MQTEPTGRAQLAEWIERRYPTQREAARKIGIDPTQLSQVLTGKRRPGLDNAVRIWRETGISVVAWVPSVTDELEPRIARSAKKRRIGRS